VPVETYARDLAWVRERGLDAIIAAHAAFGGVVLGLCGGLQMLGQTLHDPHGLWEPWRGHDPVLDCCLLPPCSSAQTAATYEGPFHDTLARIRRSFGLGIRRLRNPPGPHDAYRFLYAVLRNSDGKDLGACGSVMGLYAHGMYRICGRAEGTFSVHAPRLDEVFDGLADFIDRHFEPASCGASVRLVSACAQELWLRWQTVAWTLEAIFR